jgi:sulfonate transport system substrate-binding protein
MALSDDRFQLIFKLVALALLMAIFFGGYFLRSGDAASPSDETKKTLRVGDILGAQKMQLEAAGENSTKDYELEWSNFSAGPPIVAAATGGSIDVGWMAETPVIFAQASASPITVIGVAVPEDPARVGIGLAVAEDSDIHSPEQLKGKKVALLPGTILHYVLIQWLEQAGLSLSDIQPVNLMANTASSAGQIVRDRGVDAAVLLDPILTKTLTEGGIRLIAGPSEGINSGMRYLIASQSFLQRPEAENLLADYLARVARSYEWQSHFPEKAAPYLAKLYGLTNEQARIVLEQGKSRFVPISDAVLARHQAEAETFYRLGLLQHPLDTSTMFDDRFNEMLAK